MYQQPQYAPYPPQQYAPVAQPWPPGPKSSGYRVASGIVAIVLSLFELIFFANSAYMAATWSVGAYITTAVVLAILGLGTLTTGIVLLAQHRRRNRITPTVLMALSASAILAAAVLLAGEFYGPPFLILSVLLGLPILIVLGIGLSKEKRGLV
jgi:peptidoglycan/LPS O-acetylase OafA/YrhL